MPAGLTADRLWENTYPRLSLGGHSQLYWTNQNCYDRGVGCALAGVVDDLDWRPGQLNMGASIDDFVRRTAVAR